MTNLDRFRAAMHEPPATPFAPVDLARVIAEGTRMRRLRQARIVAGSVATVAAVAAAVVLGASWLRPPDAGPVGATPTITTPSSTTPSVPPTKVEPGLGEMIGDMIRSGSTNPAGELVFYMHGLGQGRIGIVSGRRVADGLVNDRYTASEFDGPDLAPGFHAASVAMNNTPAFGYYVGPVAKVTAMFDGKPVVARQAEWSEDPSVKIWWFDPPVDEPTNLTALDANGKRLPAGHPQFGRG
ncbi:MAG TPA: hypothetical protein VM677_33525 [Actinokineospora sp.]|jgi:hypothetical protein|nr:hypothetical protein [Actinokineospora sp.]